VVAGFPIAYERSRLSICGQYGRSYNCSRAAGFTKYI